MACDPDVRAGEGVNFSAIARECGVSIKTVQSHFQILEDTFLAAKVPAWDRSTRRRLVKHPRCYLFDTGVTNALAHTLDDELNPVVKGRRFEQFVVNQVASRIHYLRLDRQLYYWRTNHGAEVDLLICRGDRILAAVAIKSTKMPGREEVGGLASFLSEHPRVPGFVLGLHQRDRAIGDRIVVTERDALIRDRLGAL